MCSENKEYDGSGNTQQCTPLHLPPNFVRSKEEKQSIVADETSSDHSSSQLVLGLCSDMALKTNSKNEVTGYFSRYYKLQHSKNSSGQLILQQSILNQHSRMVSNSCTGESIARRTSTTDNIPCRKDTRTCCSCHQCTHTYKHKYANSNNLRAKTKYTEILQHSSDKNTVTSFDCRPLEASKSSSKDLENSRQPASKIQTDYGSQLCCEESNYHSSFHSNQQSSNIKAAPREINFETQCSASRKPDWIADVTKLLHIPDYSKMIQRLNSETPTTEHFVSHRFIRGIAYFKIGKFQQAMRDLSEGERYAQETDQSGGVSLCNVYLGDLYYSSNSYSEAAKCYQKAAEYYDTDHIAKLFRMVAPTVSAIRAKCGSCFRTLSKSVEAIQEYKKAIEASTKDKDRLTAHTSLGNLYQSSGQNNEALKEYEQALGLAQKLNDHVSFAWTHGNLGNAYLGLGMKDKALFHLQKALDLTVKYEPTQSAIVRAYNNIGTAYQSMGDLDKAEEHYDLALSQAIYGNDPAGQARVYGNIGNIFIIRKMFEKAIPHYSEVLRLSSDEATVTTALHNRGCAYYEWAESKMIALEKSHSSTKDLPVGQTVFRIHCSKTVSHEHSPPIVIDSIYKLYKQGKNDLEKVLASHERKHDHIKGSSKGLSLTVSLFESNSRTFHRLQDCMVNLGNWREALLVADQSKARTLGEIMLSRKGNQFDHPLTSPLNLKQIYAIISSQSFPVLYLSHTGASILGWVLVPMEDSFFLEMFEVPLTDDQFDGKSFDYHTSYSLTEILVEQSYEMYCSVEYSEEYTAPAVTLYELIGRPFHAILKKAKKLSTLQKIILITDTYTNLLPFACMYNPESKTFLGDSFYFEIGLSFLTMGIMNQLPEPIVELPADPQNMCTIGNPTIPQFYHNNEVWSLGELPYAKREAQWVAHILGTPPILDEQATKSAILMRLMRAKVIHIASHGSSVSGFLAFSALTSTRQGEVVDSSSVLLHPEEVEKLSISPALVVLSSCDSARGTVKADGVQGMARAFLLAGAQAVLTALWRVPDESAAVFMRFFYRFLGEGLECSLALQKSILSLRCFAKYSQYIHWSGYQLTGRSVRFAVGSSPVTTILDNTLGQSSVFPRLMLVKKLQSVLVENPRLPTDIQILHGSPGVEPSEVAIDFIHSSHESFTAGVCWINCFAPDLINASFLYIKKVTINRPLNRLWLNEAQQALFVLDNATKLPDSEQLLQLFKHSNVHIIILSKHSEPLDPLVKEIDKVLIRGCKLHKVKTLSTIDSTQHTVYEVFKKNQLSANNNDQRILEKLAEFIYGSPVIVDIAIHVLLKFIRESENPSDELNEFSKSIQLILSDKSALKLHSTFIENPFQVRAISDELTRLAPDIASVPPTHRDAWESESEYDSWDSIAALLGHCINSPGELLLLRSLAIFGCCPIPLPLVITMSSFIAQSSGHSHLGGILHERLLALKEYEHMKRRNGLISIKWGNCGDTYLGLGMKDKALFHLQKSLDLTVKYEPTLSPIGRAYSNIGTVHQSMEDLNNLVLSPTTCKNDPAGHARVYKNNRKVWTTIIDLKTNKSKFTRFSSHWQSSKETAGNSEGTQLNIFNQKPTSIRHQASNSHYHALTNLRNRRPAVVIFEKHVPSNSLKHAKPSCTKFLTKGSGKSSQSAIQVQVTQNYQKVSKNVDFKMLRSASRKLDMISAVTKLLYVPDYSKMIQRLNSETPTTEHFVSHRFIRGIAYFKVGKFQQAVRNLKEYEQALELARRLSDHVSVVWTHGNLGNTYLGLGMKDKALFHLQKPLDLSVKYEPTPSAVWRYYNNIETAYQFVEDLDKAEERYDLAVSHAIYGNDPAGQARVYGNVGNIFIVMKMFEKAIPHYTDVVCLSIDEAMATTALHNGECAYYKGAESKIIALENSSLSIKDLPAGHNIFRIHSSKAVSHEYSPQILIDSIRKLYKQGKEDLRKVLASHERKLDHIKGSSKGLSLTVSLFESNSYTFYALLLTVSLLESNSYTPQCFQDCFDNWREALLVAEQTRACTLREIMLARKGSQLDHPLTSPLNLKQVYAVVSSQSSPVLYLSHTGASILGWVLDPMEDNSIFMEMFEVPLTEDQFDMRIFSYHTRYSLTEILVEKSYEMYCSVEYSEEYTAPAITLYELIGPPLQAILKTAKKLSTLQKIDSITDAHTTLLVFARLYFPDCKIFLGDLFYFEIGRSFLTMGILNQLPEPIVQLFTMGILSQLPEPTIELPADPRSMCIVGNPTIPQFYHNNEVCSLGKLPYAKREAQWVGHILGTPPILDEQATKSAVLMRFMRAKVIHIATHGSSVSGFLAFSALTSTRQGEVVDSSSVLLHLEEVEKLSINPALVVLSSCDSARGTVKAFLDKIPYLTLEPAIFFVFLKLLQGPKTPYPGKYRAKSDYQTVLYKDNTNTIEEVISTALAYFGHSDTEVERYVQDDEKTKNHLLALLMGTFVDKRQNFVQLKENDNKVDSCHYVLRFLHESLQLKCSCNDSRLSPLKVVKGFFQLTTTELFFPLCCLPNSRRITKSMTCELLFPFMTNLYAVQCLHGFSMPVLPPLLVNFTPCYTACPSNKIHSTIGLKHCFQVGTEPHNSPQNCISCSSLHNETSNIVTCRPKVRKRVRHVLPSKQLYTFIKDQRRKINSVMIQYTDNFDKGKSCTQNVSQRFSTPSKRARHRVSLRRKHQTIHSSIPSEKSNDQMFSSVENELALCHQLIDPNQRAYDHVYNVRSSKTRVTHSFQLTTPLLTENHHGNHFKNGLTLSELTQLLTFPMKFVFIQQATESSKAEMLQLVKQSVVHSSDICSMNHSGIPKIENTPRVSLCRGKKARPVKKVTNSLCMPEISSDNSHSKMVNEVWFLRQIVHIYKDLRNSNSELTRLSSHRQPNGVSSGHSESFQMSTPTQKPTSSQASNDHNHRLTDSTAVQTTASTKVRYSSSERPAEASSSKPLTSGHGSNRHLVQADGIFEEDCSNGPREVKTSNSKLLAKGGGNSRQAAIQGQSDGTEEGTCSSHSPAEASKINSNILMKGPRKDKWSANGVPADNGRHAHYQREYNQTSSRNYQQASSNVEAAREIDFEIQHSASRKPDWISAVTELLHVPDFSKMIQRLNSETPTTEHFVSHRFIRGIAYFKIGKFQQAMRDLSEGERYARETDQRGGVSLCNVYLGDLYYSSGSYLEAAKCYQKAAEYYDIHNIAKLFRMVAPTVSAIRAKCGSCFHTLSKSVEAIQEYQKAIEASTKDKDRLTVHTSLGNLYQSSGQNNEALNEYEQALGLAQKLNDHVSVAWTHGNLGNAYLGLGMKDKALFHLHKALDLTVKYEPTPSAIGRAYNNIGTAYQSMGDLDKAEEHYDLALSQAIYGNDPAGQARVYGNIGNIFIVRKMFEKAIPHYSEVLRLSTDEATVTTALHNRGCAYYELAESKMVALEKSSSSTKDLPASHIVVRIHGSKTVSQEHSPRIVINSVYKLYKQGKDDLEKVLALHERKLDHIKGSSKWLSLTVSLFESNSHTFHRLQDCMVNLGNWREALLVAEQSKARTLGEIMLSRKGSQLNHPLTSPLRLKEVYAIVSSQSSPVLYLSHTGASILGWVLVPMEDNSIFMEMFEVPLTDDQFDGKSFDYHTRYSLTEILVEQSYEMYCSVEYSEEYTAPAVTLYELIGRPFHAILKKAKKLSTLQKIILITDTYTNLLPFACMYNPESKTFLGDSFYFEIGLSFLTMGIMNQLPEPIVELPADPQNMCTIGNPTIPQFYHNNEVWSLGKLPYAKREAQWVGHILGTPPILDEQATKSAILMRLMRAKVIHIATHGSSVSGFLAFSALTSTRQGEVMNSSSVLLHPEEVEKLSISPALVVLSSCDSARGTVKADGVQGMARAFLLAGAQAVLTALWRVPDESAAVFMRFFYRFLGGLESSLALQKSILSLRCFAKYSQYIHWSGYQLTGRSIHFTVMPLPVTTILDNTFGKNSVFPRLMLVKKLRSVVVEIPRPVCISFKSILCNSYYIIYHTINVIRLFIHPDKRAPNSQTTYNQKHIQVRADRLTLFAPDIAALLDHCINSPDVLLLQSLECCPILQPLVLITSSLLVQLSGHSHLRGILHKRLLALKEHEQAMKLKPVYTLVTLQCCLVSYLSQAGASILGWILIPVLVSSSIFIEMLQVSLTDYRFNEKSFNHTTMNQLPEPLLVFPAGPQTICIVNPPIILQFYYSSKVWSLGKLGHVLCTPPILVGFILMQFIRAEAVLLAPHNSTVSRFLVFSTLKTAQQEEVDDPNSTLLQLEEMKMLRINPDLLLGSISDDTAIVVKLDSIQGMASKLFVTEKSLSSSSKRSSSASCNMFDNQRSNVHNQCNSSPCRIVIQPNYRSMLKPNSLCCTASDIIAKHLPHHSYLESDSSEWELNNDFSDRHLHSISLFRGKNVYKVMSPVQETAADYSNSKIVLGAFSNNVASIVTEITHTSTADLVGLLPMNVTPQISFEQLLETIADHFDSYTSSSADQPFSCNFNRSGLQLSKTENHVLTISSERNLPKWISAVTELLHVPDYSKMIQRLNSETPTTEHFVSHRFIRGIAYFKIGKFQQAMRDLSEGEKYAQETDQRGSMSLCNVYLGDLYYSSGSHSEAAKYYKKAAEYYDADNLTKLFRMVAPTLSAIHAKCGNYCHKPVEAIHEYRKAVESAIKDNDRFAAHMNLGKLYQSLDQSNEALKEYERALKVAEKLTMHDRISVHHNIGNTYLGQNIIDKAFYHLQIAFDLTLKHKPTTPVAIGQLYNSMGTAYQFIGNLEKAEEYYTQALNQAIYDDDSNGQARAFGNIGNVLTIKKQFKEAIHHYTNALQLSTDRATVTTAYHDRGCAYYEWAKQATASLSASSSDKTDHKFSFRIHGSKLPVSQRDHSVPDSIVKLYKQGINNFQEVLKSQEQIFEANSRNFDYLQECMVNIGDWREALLVAEQSRARTLGEMMLRRKTSQIDNSPTSPLNLEQVFAIVSSQSSPVLYISTTGGRILGWVLIPIEGERSISMDMFEVPLGDNQFDGNNFDYHLRYNLTEVLLKQCHELYCSVEYNLIYTAPFVDLYKLIGRPLQAILRRYEVINTPQKIVVIPDAHTALLPFASLYNPDKKSFLSNSYYFEIVPSLFTMGILNRLPKPVIELPADPQSMCIIGNPTIPQFHHNNEIWSLGKLPYAKREAQWVGHILGTPPILDEQATKSAVLMRFMRAKVIHIATHGSSVSGFLAFSALTSTRQGEVVDSSSVLLHLEEVEKLSINPALVVLSSCDSARGSLNTDGIQGMARAFTIAGAQAVLTAIWRVPDESAAIFMKIFYRYLVDGFESSLALQKSILSLRCFSKYSQYIHWSGYQLTGRSVTFDVKHSPLTNHLESSLGLSNAFPRLEMVKKLESALINSPRLPTDVQILHGCPGVTPSEIVIDFIYSSHVNFEGGIFWINCRTIEFTNATISYIEKKIQAKMHLNVTEETLFILDDATELPSSSQLLQLFKHSSIHIIILAENFEPLDPLAKEIDKVLLRGCKIHEVKTLSTIDSTQRTVYEVFKKNQLSANNEDQRILEKLAEFTFGSPVIVDIAIYVLLKFIKKFCSEGLSKFSHVLELERRHKTAYGSYPRETFSELTHPVSKVAHTIPTCQDNWESKNEFDSWDSFTALLDHCINSQEELVLLRTLAMFGCCPIPFPLLETMWSMIVQSSEHSHPYGIHERLMGAKVLKIYPLPVVLHASSIRNNAPTELHVQFVYIPKHLSTYLWTQDPLDQMISITLAFRALKKFVQFAKKHSEFLQFCLALVSLLREKIGHLTDGKLCSEKVQDLYLHIKFLCHVSHCSMNT